MRNDGMSRQICIGQLVSESRVLHERINVDAASR